jgi:hypothetical protein
MMTKELGVWTAEDCALVLIDYQNEMFEVIRSETNADLFELHVRLLAKTAKAFGMPIVLSTVGVGYGFNGPTLPSVLSELDGIEPIDRSSMNAFEDAAFREAVKATGRNRLIIAGLHTEICLTFASVQALKIYHCLSTQFIIRNIDTGWKRCCARIKQVRASRQCREHRGPVSPVPKHLWTVAQGEYRATKWCCVTLKYGEG